MTGEGVCACAALTVASSAHSVNLFACSSSHTRRRPAECPHRCRSCMVVIPTDLVGIASRVLETKGHGMTIRLGDEAPDFTAETTEGTIDFKEWKQGSWAVLFSHPKDFTPVCTTELGTVAKLKPEFDKRHVKVIGLSVDPVKDHVEWSKDIAETQGQKVNFPMIADPDRKVSELYDMIHPNANDTLTVRSVFVIGADKKIKLIITYPASTGRNFDEILRVIDSLQLTANYSVATPVNWKDGEDVIIVTAVSDEDAKAKFPKGWKTLKPYLRVTPQPNK